MKIVGYTDRLSVQPGETIRCMVSAEVSDYEAEVVRLIHGDPNPAGPGVKEEMVACEIGGPFPGRTQRLPRGSYVLVDDPSARLAPAGAFRLHAHVFATTPGRGAQGLLTRWDAATSSGYALVLDADGALGLWLGGGTRVARITTGTPLAESTWYAVSAVVDLDNGVVELTQEPLQTWPIGAARVHVREPLDVTPAPAPSPFLVAAWHDSSESRWHDVAGHFNGKVDRPSVWCGGEVVAEWDFAAEVDTSRVVDVSGNGLSGVAVNMPMRAVTGHNFSGRETDFRREPEEYGAIFFHDDDLEDARWDVDFEFTVPSTLRSGVYAVRLRSGEDEDHLPFYVRPPRGTATARIALLLPTYTYLAYANSHPENPGPQVDHNVEDHFQPEDRYVRSERLLSLYDNHRDGTGVCYASRLRPLATIRPRYILPENRAPADLSADLHLVDWLETKGYAYDVITDEDLDAEGAELLKRYRVVVTGTHNEYLTGGMLDSLEAYLAAGGRLMYLSGNGMYWPVGIAPDRPHIMEVRRGHNGTSTWRSAPGENHLSTTGELGGIWRDRGRAPQKLVGVGFAAVGLDGAWPYYREPGSYDPRAAFIFEGVADDEPIGDTGLVMGGAAGMEVDRVDYALGSPPHTLVLASARNFPKGYFRVVEEAALNEQQGESDNPLVRADLAFFETPNDGAVFSTGSMTWCGSLSASGYENAVSRIMQNVLDAFEHDGPLPRATASGAAITIERSKGE